MSSSAVPSPARAAWRVTLGGLFVTVVAVLLFVPKVNVLPIPGFSVQIKPEDLVWVMMLPLLVLQRRLVTARAAHVAWLALLGFVAVSALVHPSNLALAVRLYFYSFPLIYGMTLDERQLRRVAGLCTTFLALFVVVALAQAHLPVPALHTGELLLGPIDRPPGMYGNGVEFALIAFAAFWLAYLAGERRPWVWLLATGIAAITGTRVVTALLLTCGLLYLDTPRRRLAGAATLAVLALAVSLGGSSNGASEESGRLSDVDPEIALRLVDVVRDAGAGGRITQTDDYCFDFDDSLADDQSFAMRLSKLLFVVQNVVLGEHPLGFGLGKCIGDAGDNLFVRALSDGGLPYFALVVAFFVAVTFARPGPHVPRPAWWLFAISLWGASLFYDTLYFSRVAPLLLGAIAIALAPRPRLAAP